MVPSFVLIFLGWLARARGLMSREIMNRIAKLTFKYVLSVKIFNDVAASDPENFSNVGMVSFCAVATMVMVALIFCFIYYLTELSYSVFDPRLRKKDGKGGRA